MDGKSKGEVSNTVQVGGDFYSSSSLSFTLSVGLHEFLAERGLGDKGS